MAGSYTLSVNEVTRESGSRTLTIAWTGDVSNGTVPSFSSDSVTVTLPNGRTMTLTKFLLGYYLLVGKLTLGTTAPSGLTITANDSDSLDWFQAKLTSASVAGPTFTNIQTNVFIDRALTFACSGNATASATWTLVLYLLNAAQAQPSAP